MKIHCGNPEHYSYWYRNELLLHTTQHLKICTQPQKMYLIRSHKAPSSKNAQTSFVSGVGGGGGRENQACWAGSLLRSTPNPEVKPCDSVGRLIISIKGPSPEMYFLKIQTLSACARMVFTIFDRLTHTATSGPTQWRRQQQERHA